MTSDSIQRDELEANIENLLDNHANVYGSYAARFITGKISANERDELFRDSDISSKRKILAIIQQAELRARIDTATSIVYQDRVEIIKPNGEAISVTEYIRILKGQLDDSTLSNQLDKGQTND